MGGGQVGVYQLRPRRKIRDENRLEPRAGWSRRALQENLGFGFGWAGNRVLFSKLLEFPRHLRFVFEAPKVRFRRDRHLRAQFGALGWVAPWLGVLEQHFWQLTAKRHHTTDV